MAGQFEQPKVLVKDTTKDFACTYEDRDFYVKDVLIVIPKPGHPHFDLRALAGIINSKALRFFYRTTFNTLHVQSKELASLPLPKLDMRKREDVDQIERLAGLVSQILRTIADLQDCVTESDTAYLETRIGALDRQIDELVYRLYGLDEKDIVTIQAALGS